MSRYIDAVGHPITQSVLVDQSGALLEADDTDAQPVIFTKARNYVWDPNALAWVRETQPTAGGGGGSVTQGTSPWVDNITQFGGNNVVTGTGTSGLGIPRVTVSNDSVISSITSTVTVGGTVTANAGSNLNTSALALDASVNGILLAQASSTSGQKGPVVQGAVTTNAPTYTTAQTDPLSLDTSGLLRTSLKDTPANTNNLNINLAASAATVTVSGTVTTTPPSNASTNIAQFGGTNVSTGTGASGAGMPRVTVSNDSAVKLWDGTTVVSVIAGTTALKSDLASIAGTATVTAAAGVQKVGIVGGTNTSLESTAGVLDGNIKNINNAAVSTAASGVLKVGIVGNAGATVDSTIGAATAPTNALTIAGVNQTTAPSLTIGQAIALQVDYEGSLFVKPYRRAQTVSQATTISASVAATTILAAQSAGIFADISNLIVTVTPATGAVADIAFTITLSDGTKSYIYDMDTGATGTATVAGSDPVSVNIQFNPPLPASSTATAWTQTNSVSTGVVTHTTVVSVLQKAS